jgi:hypothetical protein
MCLKCYVVRTLPRLYVRLYIFIDSSMYVCMLCAHLRTVSVASRSREHLKWQGCGKSRWTPAIRYFPCIYMDSLIVNTTLIIARLRSEIRSHDTMNTEEQCPHSTTMFSDKRSHNSSKSFPPAHCYMQHSRSFINLFTFIINLLLPRMAESHVCFFANPFIIC